MIEVPKRVVVDFHMVAVALDGQTDQPEKVYQEEGPVDRDFEYLEKGAEPCGETYGADLFPQVELCDGSEDGSVAFYALETEVSLDESDGLIEHLVGIGES